jgi:hypothetical protein
MNKQRIEFIGELIFMIICVNIIIASALTTGFTVAWLFGALK